MTPAPPPAVGVALTDVNLARCGLSAEAAAVLCATLAQVGRVQALDLSGNAVYLRGALAVAELVTSTKSLRRVRLAGCRLQWAPEMVDARARERKGGGSRAAAHQAAAAPAAQPPSRPSGSGSSSRDAAVEYDPTALFALADVAKRTRQLEECDLADEDASSVPGRQIRQSLAINRAIAYRRHADLVAKCVPPLKDPPRLAQRPYALTLDVDAKFLLREQLLHLNAAGVLFDVPPPPLDPPDHLSAAGGGGGSRGGPRGGSGGGQAAGGKSWLRNPLSALGLSKAPEASTTDAAKGANTGDFSLCGGSDAYYIH